jgi:hypothetical protein
MKQLKPQTLMAKSHFFCLTLLALSAIASEPEELRVGIAGHAFDHLAAIGEQADAAAASGANIIYITGLGGLGYSGLPAPEEILRQRTATQTYLRQARQHGIRLAIGYICATSIVKLETFDRNWPANFRVQFHSAPAEWRQQSRDGTSLPSWYGGDYQAACMNHPDWRAYEKFIVRQQLESGCDGIFFDNPTVHPQGCYCPHCMSKFEQFLKTGGLPSTLDARRSTNSTADARAYAISHPTDFMRFRATVARDFLAEMRAYARGVKRGALMTANNSLNSADALFSQSRTYGYNIYEMSQAEDLVVVEDMSSQPRTLPNGQTIEYGPTYEQLRAISHGKPIVAVNLAEADYHTPPSLVRLAQAEAAAHASSYLSWPTWPEPERQRMISQIRPQADFLRRNAGLLNDSQPRRDVILFLPFRKWVTTNQCVTSRLAAALTRANVQYEAICEDELQPNSRTFAAWRGAKVLLSESRNDFTLSELKQLKAITPAGGTLVTADNANWLREVQSRIGEPSLTVEGPSSLRAVVRDQSKRTIIHLLNLNVQRRSSFEDHVEPATNILLTCRVPFVHVRSVHGLTADGNSASGPLPFRTKSTDQGTVVQAKVPRLEISLIVVIER